MERLRLFTAVRPPERALDEVERAARDLRERAGAKTLRAVRRANLHVTLHFLGETDASLVEPLASAMEAAVAPVTAPVELELAPPGAFPNARRPRTVWVGVHDASGALAALELRLRRNLVSPSFGGAVQLDERPFRPHITIGYVNKRLASSESRSVTRAIQETRVEPVRFLVTALVLVQSVLGRGGSTYTDIRTIALPVTDAATTE
ncbi:MAG: RNA 2',3'-cyclic phosphodiesterase [Spirochaetota bacterium]